MHMYFRGVMQISNLQIEILSHLQVIHNMYMWIPLSLVVDLLHVYVSSCHSSSDMVLIDAFRLYKND